MEYDDFLNGLQQIKFISIDIFLLISIEHLI